jgi:hypothetical protein
LWRFDTVGYDRVKNGEKEGFAEKRRGARRNGEEREEKTNEK